MDFVNSSFNGHLHCLHFLAIGNNAVKNIGIFIHFLKYLSLLFPFFTIPMAVPESLAPSPHTCTCHLTSAVPTSMKKKIKNKS